MQVLKLLGFLLAAAAIVLLLAAVVLMFSEETFVPDPAGDRTLSGQLFGAFGVGFLVIAVVLILVDIKQAARPKAPIEPPPAPKKTTVVVKRTQMNLGSTTSVPASDPTSARLDEVNQKIARIKVQYGMGDLGREAYRVLMDELQKEKGELELQVMRRQPSG